jgi:hypothetical protein
MAASSWATYEASKALLAEHGSVAAVKAAAAKDPSIIAPLTAGLAAWSDIDARIAAAAQEVDIVIPVRGAHAREGARRKRQRKGRAWPLECGRTALTCALPRRAADDP